MINYVCNFFCTIKCKNRLPKIRKFSNQWHKTSHRGEVRKVAQNDIKSPSKTCETQLFFLQEQLGLKKWFGVLPTIWISRLPRRLLWTREFHFLSKIFSDKNYSVFHRFGQFCLWLFNFRLEPIFAITPAVDHRRLGLSRRTNLT